MDKLAGCFVYFLFCLLLAAPATAASFADIERLGSSVFRLVASDGAGRTHSGSGVMIAQNTVVTNCHVVLRAHEIRVTVPSGRLRAQLIRAHIEHDLCLLSVPGLTGQVVTLGNTSRKHEGDSIVAVGFAKGADLTATRGHIEGLFTYKGAGRVVQGSASFSPGKSGGGLFDEQGTLIGILTFKCLAGGPFHFAVPVEWVKILMRDTSSLVSTIAEKPFWKYTDQRQPIFLRAASLFAESDCEALDELASAWLAREPNNPDALFMVKRAWRCTALKQGM